MEFLVISVSAENDITVAIRGRSVYVNPFRFMISMGKSKFLYSATVLWNIIQRSPNHQQSEKAFKALVKETALPVMLFY